MDTGGLSETGTEMCHGSAKRKLRSNEDDGERGRSQISVQCNSRCDFTLE